MRVRTYAKINLFLKVVARRADGFHDVDTIYQSISLADELELTHRPEAHGLTLSVSGAEIDPQQLLQLQKRNLITATADLLELRTGSRARAGIRLHKQIPIGAGLAGGSANAAGALVALNELLKMGCTPDDLLDMAARLGSDVPFCVIGGTLRAIGRGEVLMPTPEPPELWFVLGISQRSLLTRDVYERFDEGGTTATNDSGPMVEAIESDDVDAIGAAMHNDLQPAAIALAPELDGGLHALSDAGALGAIVCGSGPTLLGLARDLNHAREIAAGVTGTFDRVEVVQTVDRGVERLA